MAEIKRSKGIESFNKDTEKLKVLAFPVDDGGCGWYRTRQPFSKLKQHDLADLHLVDPMQDSSRAVENAIKIADVIVARQGTQRLWDLSREMDMMKPIVFDTDDYYFQVSPYNEHYVDWGTEEYEHEGKKIWEFSKAHFDQYRNESRLSYYRKMLEQSAVISTTTTGLRDTLLDHNPMTVILPNCIDFDHWWSDKQIKRKSGEVRIGWAGGVSHYEDMYHVHKALNRVLKRYSHVKFVSIGHHFKGLFKGVPDDKIEAHAWIPFLAHPYRMKMLDLDIGIAPLQDTPFNRNKSEIKFSEYSALKIPTIARNIPPYAPHIEDGNNGYVYENDEDFEEKLCHLIENPKDRIDVGQRAYTWVKTNRNADAQVHLWYETYKRLHEARLEHEKESK